MRREQVGVLNALVTYAMEQLPVVSDDEREVAQIVGRWALSREGPLIVDPSSVVVLGGRMGHAITFMGPRPSVHATECSCGWESGPRPDHDTAWRDWLGHAAEQIPPEVRRYVAGRGAGAAP